MSQYTPEPWDISWEEDEQYNSFIRVGPARIYIDPGRCEEEEAAAVLISAAPELLRALQRLVKIVKPKTVREIINAGDDAIDAAGLNPWCLKEGLANGTEPISLDFAYAAIRKATERKDEE